MFILYHTYIIYNVLYIPDYVLRIKSYILCIRYYSLYIFTSYHVLYIYISYMNGRPVRKNSCSTARWGGHISESIFGCISGTRRGHVFHILEMDLGSFLLIYYGTDIVGHLLYITVWEYILYIHAYIYIYICTYDRPEWHIFSNRYIIRDFAGCVWGMKPS